MTAPSKWSEDDWIMISAIEHWSFCPRQCGLIHLEQIFEENLFTLRGRRAHERVDSGETSHEHGVRVDRSVPLWSETLGITGKADVVEWHNGVPFPIEYKSGKRQHWSHESLQLCAQAICLEEMTGIPVPAGAIYSAGARTRHHIDVSPSMRARVEDTVTRIRHMLTHAHLPPPVNDARCPQCSLIEACLPSVIGEKDRVHAWCQDLLHPGESEPW